MMHQATHYQHSGKAPFGGILLTLAGGLVAGVLLGAIYGLLIYWSPFIYINAIATFGFGVVLAAVVGAFGKSGKIRSTSTITVIALLVAVVAYYAHWVVWFGRAAGETVYDPAQIWQFMNVLAGIGPWTIFDWTPTGFSMWAIWGIEALMIIVLGTASARGVIDTPFCEATDQWAEEAQVQQIFEPIDATASLTTPQSVLQALKPAAETGAAYTEVTTATAEGSELRCVTLTSVEVEVKDNKESFSKTEIVKNMLFDRDSFSALEKTAVAA